VDPSPINSIVGNSIILNSDSHSHDTSNEGSWASGVDSGQPGRFRVGDSASYVKFNGFHGRRLLSTAPDGGLGRNPLSLSGGNRTGVPSGGSGVKVGQGAVVRGGWGGGDGVNAGTGPIMTIGGPTVLQGECKHVNAYVARHCACFCDNFTNLS
jgi:hypothetical protein